MKNILEIPSKIIVKISTILTIILALLLNRHRLLFLQYMIAFIHEIFHSILKTSENTIEQWYPVTPVGLLVPYNA